MKRFIQFLFGDWKTIYSYAGIWTISDYSFGSPPMTDKKGCLYEIQYSKNKNEYRIKTSGHDPKGHSLYPHMIDLLNNCRKGKNINP